MTKTEVTLGKLRDHYILTLRAVGSADKTTDGNERVLKFLIDSTYGIGTDVPIKELEEETVLRYLITRNDLPPIALPLIISDLRPAEAWA